MDLTKEQLAKIINEEVESVLNENFSGKTGLPVTAKGIGMIRNDKKRFLDFAIKVMDQMPDAEKFKAIQARNPEAAKEVYRAIEAMHDLEILRLMRRLGFEVQK
tara:strand:- start:4936 stop:5247 length:312 start_codon:yes stop_codon:yes gene_type:complete